MVQRATPGRLTRGDVLRVTLTVDATAERNWVVVSDPVPAGATVVGGLGGQSTLLGGRGAGERRRACQPRLCRARAASVARLFRLGAAGRFTGRLHDAAERRGPLQLPPSRVEAMYSPAIRAAVPNAPVVVAER